MKLAILSFISVIFLAEETVAKEKPLLENINIIVGIAVGIAGVIIAYLTYRASKKEKEEKQPEKQKIITAGKNVALESCPAVLANETSKLLAEKL